MDTRVCPKCKQAKPATTEHFYTQGSGWVSGWLRVCRACAAKRERQWPPRRKPSKAEAAQATRREFMAEWYGQGCAVCGGNERMHAHHRDPSEKRAGIAGVFVMCRLRREITKCVPLCAHHHSRVHYELRNSGRTTEEAIEYLRGCV